MTDAHDIDFAADTPSDWDGSGQPGEVAHALNQLAERVKDVQPGTFTDNAILRADGTAGIQDSGVQINDSNLLTAANIEATGITGILGGMNLNTVVSIDGNGSAVRFDDDLNLNSNDLTNGGTITAGTLVANTTLTMPDETVTYAKMQHVSATAKLLGRASLGSGDVEEISVDTDDFAVTGGTLASNNPRTVNLTSDQTFSTATPANVTGLAFTLASGTYYEFKFIIPYQSDTSTVGIQLGLTFPAVTTQASWVQIANGGSDGATSLFTGWITSSGDSVSAARVPSTNTDYLAIIEGMILPSAVGNLQVQAATETGTTTVTVRQGAVGKIRAIA
jgi:hypothetical protein